MQSLKTTPVNTKFFTKKTIKRDLIVFPITKPNGKNKYNRYEHCAHCNGDKWVVCDECEHEFIYCQKCKCQGIVNCEKCNHCL